VCVLLYDSLLDRVHARTSFLVLINFTIEKKILMTKMMMISTLTTNLSDTEDPMRVCLFICCVDYSYLNTAFVAESDEMHVQAGDGDDYLDVNSQTTGKKCKYLC
jgi:hypothetical protein